MSKIMISAAEPSDSAEAAMLVHRITGLSAKSALDRLKAGPRGAFYTTELFLNDHVDRDREIRALLDGLDKYRITPFVVMVGYDVAWSSVTDLEKHRVPPEALINVLDDANGRYR